MGLLRMDFTFRMATGDLMAFGSELTASPPSLLPESYQLTTGLAGASVADTMTLASDVRRMPESYQELTTLPSRGGIFAVIAALGSASLPSWLIFHPAKPAPKIPTAASIKRLTSVSALICRSLTR